MACGAPIITNLNGAGYSVGPERRRTPLLARSWPWPIRSTRCRLSGRTGRYSGQKLMRFFVTGRVSSGTRTFVDAAFQVRDELRQLARRSGILCRSKKQNVTDWRRSYEFATGRV